MILPSGVSLVATDCPRSLTRRWLEAHESLRLLTGPVCWRMQAHSGSPTVLFLGTQSNAFCCTTPRVCHADLRDADGAALTAELLWAMVPEVFRKDVLRAYGEHGCWAGALDCCDSVHHHCNNTTPSTDRYNFSMYKGIFRTFSKL